MEYTTLGSTGMTVSRICLGCMSFGTEREWMLDPEESKALIDRAIDLGINFFDTANVYSTGESEEILGDALAGYDRDSQVVATKVFGEMDPGNPNASGLSRKAIEQELAASRERLGMDTIDLYQTHRWDYETPIDETLRALDDAVRRGEVRYIGTSSMWAHQFANALQTSDALDLERFATMQNHYNVLYREEEREMLPLCDKEDIGVIPWSPLARGVATRPHEEIESTTRGRTDQYLEQMSYLQGGGEAINERIQELAADKGVSMAQISLAWLLHKDWVDAPIVGTTSVEHLEDAVEALEIDLSDSDMEYLEEPYEPLPVAGHQ
ncbi:aldo/keto reductase [Natrinema pellirubrum DSM 15624]|uniref:Aldo/keto reductase n=1 Tax=Natrinema pellirubrum (strain DSM 15624 / CIP 106293 / JCM 10476 / NCIMB 786 / 157) TaxID=797303 RepID=L0JS39_NATP1|nr:aldo/keto reductase [Natrinema pellirubrum]AGB33201.1 putative oxidoreductase, aryl-alcohol dehydrogenase like protein [Natrinema pellirubrum DSM 15624]ELY71866.1 aldo/keto reductase [Natrinema pellirubrum DSM 15624]